jgi:hypothetical protein
MKRFWTVEKSGRSTGRGWMKIISEVNTEEEEILDNHGRSGKLV